MACAFLPPFLFSNFPPFLKTSICHVRHSKYPSALLRSNEGRRGPKWALRVLSDARTEPVATQMSRTPLSTCTEPVENEMNIIKSYLTSRSQVKVFNSPSEGSGKKVSLLCSLLEQIHATFKACVFCTGSERRRTAHRAFEVFYIWQEQRRTLLQSWESSVC